MVTSLAFLFWSLASLNPDRDESCTPVTEYMGKSSVKTPAMNFEVNTKLHRKTKTKCGTKKSSYSLKLKCC